MGILKSFGSSWSAANTEEKIKIVCDIVCGIGTGAMGGMMGAAFAKKTKSKITKTCIVVSASGISGCAAEKASNALMETIGKPLAAIIDGLKKKKAEEANNDEYTRY